MGITNNIQSEKRGVLASALVRSIDAEYKEACTEFEKAMSRSDLHKPVQASFSCALLWGPYMPQEFFSSVVKAASTSTLYTEDYGHLVQHHMERAARLRYLEASDGPCAGDCGGSCDCDGDCESCACEGKESARETRKDKGFSESIASAAIEAEGGNWSYLTRLLEGDGSDDEYTKGRTAAAENSRDADVRARFNRVASLFGPQGSHFRTGQYFLDKISNWVLVGENLDSGSQDLTEKVLFYLHEASEKLHGEFPPRGEDKVRLKNILDLLHSAARNNFAGLQKYMDDANWMAGLNSVFQQLEKSFGIHYASKSKSASITDELGSGSEDIVAKLYYAANQAFHRSQRLDPKDPDKEVFDEASRYLYNAALDISERGGFDRVNFDDVDDLFMLLESKGVSVNAPRSTKSASLEEQYVNLIDDLHLRAIRASNTEAKKCASELRDIRASVLSGEYTTRDFTAVNNLIDRLDSLAD